MLKKIDKYLIERVIGEGAMAVVYKAYDPFMDRTVAIKVLRTDLLESQGHGNYLERFRREARAYGRLQHQNIVTCYHSGEEDDRMYIVMEYVDGRTLKDLLDAQLRFSLDQILGIGRQLLLALEYSHVKGVIHRDIKPANVILLEDNQVKIADFGIARIDTSELTQTGCMMGTPNYMSPEQILGHEVDHRTDLFSAGVILYQLMTGVKPFGGRDIANVMHKVLRFTPPPPSTINEEINDALDDVVSQAMAKDVNQRYQSADAFLKALDRATVTHNVDEATIIEQEAEPSDSKPSENNPDYLTNGAGSPGSDDAPVRMSQQSWLKWAVPSTLLAVVAVGLGIEYSGREKTVPSESVAEVAVPSAMTAADGAEAIEAKPAHTAIVPPPDLITIRTLLSNLDCGQVSGEISGQNVHLDGFVSSGEQESELIKAVSRVNGVKKVDSTVEIAQWPYCELMDLLPSFPRWDSNMRSVTALGAETTQLEFVQGDYLVLSFDSPIQDGYLYADYYLSDGNVVHLLPNEFNNDNFVKGGSKITLGQLHEQGQHWTVSPPFGREMITLVTAAEPLFDGMRPEVESADRYLSALRKVLLADNGKIKKTDYAFITTRAGSLAETAEDQDM